MTESSSVRLNIQASEGGRVEGAPSGVTGVTDDRNEIAPSESPLAKASQIFVYQRRVAFSETDLMGVVHHSNYVRYFEEGRVAWLRERGLINIHAPMGPYAFAVVELDARYLRPAKFDEVIEVWLQASLRGVRLDFQYAIWSQRSGEWLATGRTGLVPVNSDMRPVKLPREVREAFGQEKWDEAWPPSRKDSR